MRKTILAMAALLVGLPGISSADPIVGLAEFSFDFYENSGFYSGSGNGSYSGGVVSQSFSPALTNYSLSYLAEISPATSLTQFGPSLQINITELKLTCVTPIDISGSCGDFNLYMRSGVRSPAGYAGDVPVMVDLAGLTDLNQGFFTISAEANYGRIDPPNDYYTDVTSASNSTFISNATFVSNYTMVAFPETFNQTVVNLPTNGTMTPLVPLMKAFNLSLIDTTLLAGDLSVTPNNFGLAAEIYGTLFHGESLVLPSSLTLSAVLSPSAVPEPGTFILLGGGLAGLLWLRRRKV